MENLINLFICTLFTPPPLGCIFISICLGGLTYLLIHERYNIKKWLCDQKSLANKKIKKHSSKSKD